jgi:general secretion pathway protein I
MARRRAGFTLLEVMVAVVILAVGLSSLFTSEVGAIRIAQRARTTTIATLLARCKMGEIEEQIGKEGWPATDTDGNDECCEGAEHKGYKCEWKVQRIVLPDLPEDAMDDDQAADQLKEGAGAAAAGGPAGPSSLPPGADGADPAAAMGVPLGGLDSLMSGAGGSGGGDPLASLAMSYAFPVMKPIIEEQVRRATVTVSWDEGSSQQSFDVVQFLVNELRMLPPVEDQAEADPNAPPGGPPPGSPPPTNPNPPGKSR